MKPITVLHILHSMNRGGAENALMNYYRQIDRTKLQFDFLLTETAKCDFEDEILALGGKVYRIPVLSLKNPFKYVIALRHFFKSHPEYSIVHSHTSSKSAIPLLIAKWSRIPVRITHSHSSLSESNLSGSIRDALKPLLKVSANYYFSCGEQAAQWLYGEKFCQKGKVKIIRNVINASQFRYNLETRNRIRETLGIDSNEIVIGHVARFCDVKNHLFSVDILNALIQIRPNSTLLLVGDGPERQNITNHIRKLGLENKVKFVGVVPNVYDYEQAMDAFILPSFYEGLPLSIIEAQVSGLRCFTTKGTVSQECSVTDLVNYLSLEAGAEYWAKEIIKGIDNQRIDRFDDIQSAGYDSVTASSKLQNLYIDLSEEKK